MGLLVVGVLVVVDLIVVAWLVYIEVARATLGD